MLVRIGQILSFIAGITMLVMFFFQLSPGPDAFTQNVRNLAIIIAAFALGVGALNLLFIHGRRILRQTSEWGYSAALVGAMLVVIAFGLILGTPSGPVYDFLFQNLITTASSTFFAMLAFYIASAGYRAFRARSGEATVFLLAGILVMLGNIPLGAILWSRFPTIGTWIMTVPNTAGMRGILLGASLGYIATALRVILGIEKTHYGSGTSQ